MIANNLIQLMEHALGKTPDARHDLMATLNRAGRALVELHDWSWRRRTVTRAAVAAQNYIELPEEFGRLEKVTVPDSGVFPAVRLSSIAEIQDARAVSTVTNPAGTMLIEFESWKGQVSGEDYPSPRANIYPTPDTNGEPTFTITFARTWKRIRPNDARAQVDIPASAETALITIARMMAVAIENNTDHLLPDFKGLPDVQRLIREDGMRQDDLGPMTGGVDRYGSVNERWLNTITLT